MAPSQSSINADEWSFITSLLPEGWEQAAHHTGAFQRARQFHDPGSLLRVLLFHAVSDLGLRATAAHVAASGLANVSQVALLKRLRRSVEWLSWIALQMCLKFRSGTQLPTGLRVRVVDSSSVQAPASRGTDWRLHYSLDLSSCTCDWYDLTNATGGELLERTPMSRGDIILGDRNYLRKKSVVAANRAGAFVLMRMRWRHLPLLDLHGRKFEALQRARRLKVGHIGCWNVQLPDGTGQLINARVIATRLPAPVAESARRRAIRSADRKFHSIDERTLRAAGFLMVFTTAPPTVLKAKEVLNLYRCRWQVELAFKRLKQLLRLGRVPHKDERAARSWILAKLVVALLLEELFRATRDFSPWGYPLEALTSRE